MGFLLPRAIAPLALAIMATGALAQGVVDQQNDPAGGSGFGCGVTPILNGTIHQGFVPALDNLVAVELRLQAGSAFPAGGTTTTARIRDGSSTGTVLGQATASVAGPLSQNTQVLVRFDFTQITLVPGNTYLIEWVTPPTTELTWVGANTNPYAAGTAYSCSGNAWPGGATDFNFVTYAAEVVVEEAPQEPPTCEALLEQLREAVSGLGLSKFKQCAMDRLLDGAQRELARGKPKAACTLVLALEFQVRILSRIGVIPEDAARGILDLAADFRACIGVAPKSCDWDRYWYSKKDRHDGDRS
jgi:hypothetical protein